jgi:hypothetical protein
MGVGMRYLLLAVAAFAAGVGAAVLWHRRPSTVEAAPPPPQAAPVLEVPRLAAATPAVDGPKLAAELLTIADRISNKEVAQRLRTTLRMLPDVTVIEARVGDPFDPLRHDWAESRDAADPAVVETIAEVLTPGCATTDGRPIRLARVAVFDQRPD